MLFNEEIEKEAEIASWARVVINQTHDWAEQLLRLTSWIQETWPDSKMLRMDNTNEANFDIEVHALVTVFCFQDSNRAIIFKLANGGLNGPASNS